MQPTIIHIPEPCHENWEAMNATEQGRFCLSCQKTVVDFSVMTDQEVLQYLQQSTGNTCGRFAPDQLHRPMAQPSNQPKRFWAKLMLQFLFPAFLFTPRAKAQLGIMAFKEERPVASTPVQQPIPHVRITAIKGKVTDSLTGEPVAVASIQIKGSKTGAQADENGNFILPNPTNNKQITLIISATAYTTQEVMVKDTKTPLQIVLSRQAVQLETVVLVSTLQQKRMNYSMGGIRVMGESIVSTCNKQSKPSIIKRIADTLTGNNHISIYPNPVARGHNLSLNMKKVQKGNYRLQLFSTAGSLVQQEIIAVPNEQFNFQWPIGAQLATGNYIISIINDKGQQLYNRQITVL